MDALLGAALEYAGRGWAVFPLRPGDKRPLTANGFKDASGDEAQIRAWWAQWPDANIGLPTGAGNGISVLDVDVKAGAKGEETLAALLERVGCSLDTHAQARTWSGGRHIVFAYSELARTGAGCYGPGLDGRNDGGYIVAAPSMIEGKPYEWIVAPDALLPFPEWLQSVKPSSNGNGAPAEAPDWADELMLAGVDKGERDDQAWRLICHAREAGKSKAECVARVTLFGSRCRPPFDPATDENIMGKIDRAYAKPPATAPIVTERPWPEGVLPYGSDSEVPKSEPEGERPGLQTTGAVKKHLGRAGNWLVDRMLAVGDLSILVAKAGIGKSTFAAQLAVAVAYGKPFLARAAKQGLVVYLAFEGARSTIAQMERLGHDGDNPVILMYRGDSVESKNPGLWLAEIVTGHKPVLIIVDTLSDFARAPMGASNAGYDSMVQQLGAVYQWAQAEGCHVHLLHHGAKGDREGIDTALGTVGIVSKPGTVLDYRPLSKDQGAPRVLSGVKHREGDVDSDLPGLVLDFDRTNGLTVAGFREDVAVRELGVAIIKAVWDSPGIKQSEALAVVEGDPVAVWRALQSRKWEP